MSQLRNITIITSFLILSTHALGQDNSPLYKKANILLSNLRAQGNYPFAGKDTLIDLNKDGYKDILIEYYGLAGTGEKNRVQVFLYDNSKKRFKECLQLNNLANPTFYFDKNIITAYYIANGGGSASKLKWNGSKLDTLEYINVDVTQQGNKLIFEISSHNYITHKKDFNTPEVMRLPAEYKYMKYQPLIKKNSG